MKRNARSTILLVTVVILVLIAGLEFLLYTQVVAFLHPPKPGITINPNTLLLNVNESQFKTKDGAELHGWLIPGKPGYPVVIFAHDYGSDRAETLGKLEGLVSDLNKQGYFVFLFDFRGHGSSSGRSSLGYREADDMEGAIREVLKYKQIGRRVAVLGIGMGAIAAAEACSRVDEVKLVLLDSIYDNIPQRVTDTMLSQWPAARYVGTALYKAVDWNLKLVLGLSKTTIDPGAGMSHLFHRPVVFIETTPPNPAALKLYQAAKEPKELLQLGETAADDLMGDSRSRYKEELQKEIRKYFPPVTDQTTLEIPR